MKRKKARFFKRHWFSRLYLRVLLLIDCIVLFSLLQVFAYSIFNPPLTPLMVQRWFELKSLHYTWQPLSRIAPALQQAVMAAEDQRFKDHHGFDLVEIQEALDTFQSTKGKKMRGASTISMQVARNLYLWQGRNWFRKGLEAYYTALIELFMPKWRIMELYLNIAEWGKGIFGAEEAALYHFHVQARKLEPEQAAFLAAILPSPCRWSASKPTAYISQRQQDILAQMHLFAPFTNARKP
ncbi:monofunctional biosynthetic peptidoglycan transglycosylase [bacterium]|nr:monofunctional biosynthetic peptidoglycan transglycosylase [bacterium]